MAPDKELPDSSELKKLWEATQSRPRPRHEEAIEDLSRLLSAHVAGSLNQLKSADAGRGKVGFGAGGYQLKNWGRWLGGAGALAIVAIVAVTVSVKYIPVLRQTAPNPLSYVTQPGQRASITLAGGSKVILGPASSLKIHQSNVEIDGEALFYVNHSAERPFTVIAHGVVTRVLGTEFVVRTYDASMIRVAVRSGKVSVQSPALTASHAVLVSVNQAASVSTNGIPVVRSITDLATDFAWAEGELVLRNVPLGDALQRLTRWYGLEFRAADPALLAINVEAEFPAAYNRDRMKDLADVIGAQVIQEGNTVTFRRK